MNENTISYPLNAKTALIFIEFQNEWLSGQGKLRQMLIEDEIAFVSAIAKGKTLLQKGRESDAMIIHVCLRPDADYRVLGQAEYGLRAAIPKAQTWQQEMADIHGDFIPQPGEIVINERTGASAFAGSMLDSVLRNNHIDTLYLAGFASHVCVESTLRQGHDIGYNICVVTDATAAFNVQQQDYFETQILHHFGKGIKTADIS
ncbi:cysteine hydrolase [Thalassomonas sp. RHCl1]|uniref:cysteine hydrolase n=1 Tax=Thalassomonas sp. RHCl1 TaxID=2995320 RepID=UPI00248B91CF|nr:cysteine hydrolase [Thalassomonas sp. RHCl1]